MRKSPGYLPHYARRGAPEPASRSGSVHGTARWPLSERAARLPCVDLDAAGAAGEGRAVRPRVPQAAARLAPRGRREVNGKEHVRVQREHQMANGDAPVARRRSRPAAPRRGKTPRARSFGRRSARWPATRSSSRERDLVVVRRAPHCEIDADANAARCAHNRVVRAVVVEPPTASIGAWNLDIQPNRRPATIRGVWDTPPA